MNNVKYYIASFLMLISLSSNAEVRQLWDTLPDSILVHKSQAKILVEKDNYLKATVSSALEIQMRHVVCEDGTEYICYVRTYSAPEKESVVEIYDKNWNKVRTLSFSLDQIIGSDKATMYDKYFEPLLIFASLNEDSNEMVLTVSDKGLSEEEKKEIKVLSLQTNVKLGSELLK